MTIDHKGAHYFLEKKMTFSPLVSPSNVLFLPLHIKLVQIEQFVTALNKDSDCYYFLLTKSDAKMIAGIFNGPHICEHVQDEIFLQLMSELGKSAGLAYKK